MRATLADTIVVGTFPAAAKLAALTVYVTAFIVEATKAEGTLAAAAL